MTQASILFITKMKSYKGIVCITKSYTTGLQNKNRSFQIAGKTKLAFQEDILKSTLNTNIRNNSIHV